MAIRFTSLMPRHSSASRGPAIARSAAFQVAVFVLLAVTLTAQGPVTPVLQGEGHLRVMTYNMYLGTPYSGLTTRDLTKFYAAASKLISDVRASNPPARAEAIARQIGATRPHLVGLQEVATWSTGTSPDNLTLEFDFLQLLLDALAAQGTPYVTVGAFQHYDATIPTSPASSFVRNTLRVAVIARTDLKPEDFSYSNIQAASWAATLIVPIPALNTTVPFPRGWLSADIVYRGKPVRFIAAHLDHQAALNLPQGDELLAGPAATTLPVIIAADLNVDASNPSDETFPTYAKLLDAGFLDAWTAANPFEPGYTVGDLPNLTERSDYLMARPRFQAKAALLVGEEEGDRTPGGLWPSDHCGVFAMLQWPDGN